MLLIDRLLPFDLAVFLKKLSTSLISNLMPDKVISKLFFIHTWAFSIALLCGDLSRKASSCVKLGIQ